MSRLELIVGPMFSGKTTELIRRATRHRIAGRDVVVYKPAMDDRYSDSSITSHDGQEVSARLLGEDEWVIDVDADVVAFDEAQFLDNQKLALVTSFLLEEGKLVIVAGLDKNYLGNPFNYVMAHLVAIADSVTKLSAVCTECGCDDASMTQKTEGGNQVVEVGGSEKYEARCRDCWDPNVGG